MATLVPGSHPLLAYPPAERRDYLTIVATMALADGQIDDVEESRLRELCDQFDLTASYADIVGDARAATELEPLFARLTGSELRYALLVDLIDLAVGDDGDIGPEEARELDVFADALDITNGQLGMTTRFVLERRTNADAEPDADTIAGLAGVGVPIAALAVMAPLGAPLAAGLGLAAALGVGSFVSARWLVRKIRGGETDDAPSTSEDAASTGSGESDA